MSDKPIIRHCRNCEWCVEYHGCDCIGCRVLYKDIFFQRIKALICRYYKQIGTIKNMPTAYDVDAAVAEIRRSSGNGYRDIDGDYVPPLIETKDAINIVRRWGK